MKMHGMNNVKKQFEMASLAGILLLSADLTIKCCTKAICLHCTRNSVLTEKEQEGGSGPFLVSSLLPVAVLRRLQ
jgi:hypothetical protein